MEGLKLSTNPTLQRHFAVSIVHFLVTFGISHSICCLKMVANICANLHATSGSRFRGAEAATKALVHVLTPAAVCDVAAPHAVLWSKLAQVWSTPHIPLLTIVLTEAEMTLLPRILTQMWPHVTSPSTPPPQLCHSTVTLPEAVAAAAARSPDVMAHVIALLKQEYCPQVLDHLATSFPSACVPVVCDLIPLALSHFQGGSLSGLIPLLPLHGHLDIASHVPPLPDCIDWPPNLILRPYQVQGITWLYFLASHRLHGILADDMGLGKTLQVLCSIAVHKQLGHKLDTAPPPYSVLVVCPPIVMAHWVREVHMYFRHAFPNVVMYGGVPAHRRLALQRQIIASKSTDGGVVVVTSYATLHQDRSFFHSQSFIFCVADEVHLCRNPTNATTQTLLGVRAAHRIAVTGTPIQNSVVDIWSVCEFIMPGYLGDATSFRHHAVGPIAASRKPTATVAQKEAGALAITNLHAKIAPFVLRRTKDAVLSDLPPKSIQDIPCSLTPMQTQLYMAADSLDTAMATWRQRQQICMHPKLVDDHLYAHETSGKMIALVELMGLIHGDNGDDNLGEHRSLVSAIVDEFNQELSIHTLVLTTSIGGLGLNLVTADTVVFVEHSWNPFVDLQAMDRVHRVGQVKPVTVYRLLAENTIEDQVLTAQRFKIATADAVVGA
ncbi:hypothetical protein DYB38_007508 [Aphanomyces astaci]|uniref:Helicase ATP-binding domain-containing protein n=2 Tax=Aphanomyces astaci TaxID=112090 RepID=A0A397DKL9_APHAT|nr:hypothetical protein DYB38_007508 [Aphanomyces astaci]